MKKHTTCGTFPALIVLLALTSGCVRGSERATTYDSASGMNPAGDNRVIASIQDQNIAESQSPDLSAPPESVQHPGYEGVRQSTIVVYYFHPTARCETCLNIEAYSKEAVDEWKKKHDRRVEWKMLNIEEEENEQYLSKYSLQFSSLVLSEQQGGKELKWKNLEEIWNLSGNKNEFIRYLNDELNQFVNIKQLQKGKQR